MYQIAGTGFLNPLIGVTAGVLILGESINAFMIAGALMTAGGVFIILARARPPKPPPLPET